MSRLVAASVSALCAWGCLSDPPRAREQQAIFGGALATQDRAVVAVVNFAGGQCSGSLISRQLVLTARHCVADTEGREVEVVCGETPFEPPDSPGAIFVVSLPEITDDERDYHAVKAIHMPADAEADLCGTDVVLLELEQPLADVDPVTPRLTAVTAGEAYSAIGYGADESITGKPSGVRKRLDAQTVVCRGAECGVDDVRDNEWVGSGGPCRGDSGGPALDADGLVIGVVSRGASGCEEPVFGDLATRADWLIAKVVAAAASAREQPPSWAPCGARNPCYEPEPSNVTTTDEPAGTCSFVVPAPRGVTTMLWLSLGALALLLGRKSFGRRCSSHRHGDETGPC